MIVVSQPAVYSHTRIARGPALYIAGQTPVAAGGTVPEGAEAQTRAVLDKIAALLAGHGLGWAAVVKLTYYLRDIGDLAAVRRVLLEVLPEPRPAATLVEINALIDERFLIEIDAIAELNT